MTRIDSAARTLAHLTDHFASHKQLAMKMRQSFAARQRGYFTPREDDQVRHLLISYWQSRKALFELIDEVTDDTKRIDQLESNVSSSLMQQLFFWWMQDSLW